HSQQWQSKCRKERNSLRSCDAVAGVGHSLTIPEEMMISIEASSENPCSLYSSVCYSPQAEKVSKFPSLPADLPKVGAIVTYDNDIHIAGGQVPLKNTKTNHSNTGKLQITFRTVLYLCNCGDSYGGELNRRTVERYDTEKDEWTVGSLFCCAWQWRAAVVVHDCIYVMTLNLRYCYFPRSESQVETALGQTSRSFASAEAFDDKIFSTGGLHIAISSGIRVPSSSVDGSSATGNL
ncbi:hypothetical protein U0070_002900, partial [Myodes glareolus]